MRIGRKGVVVVAAVAAIALGAVSDAQLGKIFSAGGSDLSSPEPTPAKPAKPAGPAGPAQPANPSGGSDLFNPTTGLQQDLGDIDKALSAEDLRDLRQDVAEDIDDLKEKIDEREADLDDDSDQLRDASNDSKVRGSSELAAAESKLSALEDQLSDIKSRLFDIGFRARKAINGDLNADEAKTLLSDIAALGNDLDALQQATWDLDILVQEVRDKADEHDRDHRDIGNDSGN